MNGYLLCFDLDGTLIDSRDDIAAAVNHTLKHYGLQTLENKKVAELLGHGIMKTMEKALKFSNADDIDILKAGRIAADFYLEHPVNKTTLYPGVTEGLQELCACGFNTGLITNKIQPLTENVLSILGIRQHIHYIVGAEGGFPMKPAPDAILWMMNKSGIPKERTFMIGDSSVDIRTGQNAEVRTCLVSYGYRFSDDLTADIKVDTFEQFVKYIKKTCCC